MSPCQGLSAMEADNSSTVTSNTGNGSIGDIGTPERVQVPRVSFLPCSYLF